MAKESPSQRKSIGRVMHEYKHGELKSGPGGRAGKVKNPRQAVAIALHEAGASKYDSPSERRRSYRRTKRKERRGETAQQESEGKRRVGARGRRESSRAMGGKTPAARPASSAPRGGTCATQAASRRMRSR